MIERGLRFLADVEDIRRFGLHAIGHFHRLDDAFHLLIGAGRGLAHLLELLEEVELAPLFDQRELRIIDVADEFLRVEIAFDDYLLGLLFAVFVLLGFFGVVRHFLGHHLAIGVRRPHRRRSARDWR